MARCPGASELLITVAPTGAKTAMDCEAAGAVMIHVHIRDDEHRPTFDLVRLTDTVTALHEAIELVVQLSIGGSVRDPPTSAPRCSTRSPTRAR